MVHSGKEPAGRAMLYTSPVLGLPKSPSFHSGLDLVATSDLALANMSTTNNATSANNNSCPDSDHSDCSDTMQRQLPLLSGTQALLVFPTVSLSLSPRLTLGLFRFSMVLLIRTSLTVFFFFIRGANAGKGGAIYPKNTTMLRHV